MRSPQRVPTYESPADSGMPAAGVQYPVVPLEPAPQATQLQLPAQDLRQGARHLERSQQPEILAGFPRFC